MYRGVSWYPSGQMWEAIITVKNKRRHLGYFHDELEAAQAYDRCVCGCVCVCVCVCVCACASLRRVCGAVGRVGGTCLGNVRRSGA
jgi:hypothetical protein